LKEVASVNPYDLHVVVDPIGREIYPALFPLSFDLLLGSSLPHRPQTSLLPSGMLVAEFISILGSFFSLGTLVHLFSRVK